MYTIIRGAIIVQLAEYHGLSKNLQDLLEYMAMASPEQINDSIEARITSSRHNDKDTFRRLSALKQSIGQLKLNMQFDEDFATMLANYEALTGRRFVKPSWLSGEMDKVETPAGFVA